jgi:lysophospholipase L1-like esterase
MRGSALALLLVFPIAAQYTPPSGGGGSITVPASAAFLGSNSGSQLIAPTSASTLPGTINGVALSLATYQDYDPSNFIAYYTMEEGSGSTLIDHSGHANNGTQVGTVTWAGGGTSFASSSSNYWSLPAAVTAGSALRTVMIAVAYGYTGQNTTTGVCNATAPIGPITASASFTILVSFDANGSTCNLAPVLYAGAGSAKVVPDQTQGFGVHIWTYVVDPSVAANNHIYIDGVESGYQFTPAVEGITTVQLALGAWPAAPTSFSGTIYSAAFATSQLTPAQVAAATTTMRQKLIARGVITSPPDNDTNNQLVFVGDSLTLGAFATSSAPPRTVTTTDSSFARVNLGITSMALTQMNNEIVGALLQRQNQGQRRVAVVWGGTNDLCGTGGGNPGYGATAAQAWQRYAAIANILHAAGYRVVISTMIDRTNAQVATCETLKTAFNALIYANWFYVGDALADPASNANLGPNGVFSNATYYNADGTHLTGTGYSLVATYFSTAINSLTFPAIYSATGTPVGTCVAANNGQLKVVSDATLPTFLGTYMSGGSVTSPVICNGSNWVTY